MVLLSTGSGFGQDSATNSSCYFGQIIWPLSFSPLLWKMWIVYPVALLGRLNKLISMKTLAQRLAYDGSLEDERAHYRCCRGYAVPYSLKAPRSLLALVLVHSQSLHTRNPCPHLLPPGQSTETG